MLMVQKVCVRIGSGVGTYRAVEFTLSGNDS